MSKNLPEEFIRRMHDMGLDDVVDALGNTTPSVSIRINPSKGMDVPVATRPVPWNQYGFYLDSRPVFTFDPAFHQGSYYVQDASSMAIAKAVEKAVEIIDCEKRPLRYLDACAAPGGKTTAAIVALPTDAYVVANEFDPRRTSILQENIAKWGHAVTITRGDASAIKGMDGFFDIIAADMPCSGEGMMRKDSVAVEQWSSALVAECASRQKAIAQCLWDCLAPGGVLIYSTCTFNTAENEEVVQWLIDEFEADPVAIDALESAPGVSSAIAPFAFPAYRFMPGRSEGEGLFMAMLHKPSAGRSARIKPSRFKLWAGKEKPLNGKWSYILDGNLVKAVKTAHIDLASHVAGNMHVVNLGTDLFEIKGKDCIPSQELALAVDFDKDSYPKYEVDRNTALSYLRREAITLDGAPKGFVLLTYDNLPLGFVKNLGNRANNLYPANWRIRSASSPEQDA